MRVVRFGAMRQGLLTVVCRLFDDGTVAEVAEATEFYADLDGWLAQAGALAGGRRDRRGGGGGAGGAGAGGRRRPPAARPPGGGSAPPPPPPPPPRGGARSTAARAPGLL